jgi:uncharacterized membrane protein YphA (DoxX/SURF4 family)
VFDSKLNGAWWALRVGLGLSALLAGLDKFFGLLANWEAYLSPLALAAVPLSAEAFMRVVGVIEMAAGALLLAGFTRVGGYVVMAWLTAIALNLVATGGYLDVAVRDVGLAIAAFTLARLTEVRMAADVPARERAAAGAGWGLGLETGRRAR